MAKKILVVDYEPKSLDQTCKLLQNAGYDIIKAKDGLAAIEVFKKEKPQGVVLAAMLPKMHGFEVCRNIKSTPEGKNTPLVITTGVYKGEKYKRQALTEYGADGFFEKPYNPNDFLNFLNEIINQQSDSNSIKPVDLDTDLEAKLEDTLSGLMEIGSDSDVISTDTNLEAKLEDTLAGLMNIDEADSSQEGDSDSYFNPLELSSEQEADQEEQEEQDQINKLKADSSELPEDEEDKYDISDIDDRLEDTLSSMLSDDEEPDLREDTDIDQRLRETLSGLDMSEMDNFSKPQEDEGQNIDATIEFDTLNAIREKEEKKILDEAKPEKEDELFIEEKIETEPPVDIIREDTKTDIIEKYGQYELIQKIATGGMAELFKARRINVEGFEKIVAIKRILPHLAEDKEFITMFIDEARLAAQLTHQNIVQIYDLDKVNNSFYISMEYVKGKNAKAVLQKLKKARNVLPIELTLLIISKVCSALDYAHRRRDFQNRLLNIVHRDVSPQNILISYEGEVKLVDFGIAKAATKASQTQAGALKGKILYMSPEQAWGKKVDKRSDIYSIGIVLFELLTGKRLFSGSSEIDILEKVRKSLITLPSELNPQVPEELDRIVNKALAKDPKDRYQNASDLQHDIENLLFSPGLKARKYSLSNLMKFLFKDEMVKEGEELEGKLIDYFSKEEEKESEAEKIIEPPIDKKDKGSPQKDLLVDESAETIEIDTFKDLSSQSQSFVKSDKKEIKEAKKTISDDWEGREADLDTHKDLNISAEEPVIDQDASLPDEDIAEEEEFEIPTALRKKKTPLPLIIGAAAAVIIIVFGIFFFTGGEKNREKDETREDRFVIETEEIEKENDILTPEEIRRQREEQERKEQINSLIAKINESLEDDQIGLARNYIAELRAEDPNNPNITNFENTLNKREGELQEQRRQEEQAAEQEDIRRQQEQERAQLAELLGQAEQALNAQNYEQAQSIARNILDIDSGHERASQIFGLAGNEIDRINRERQKQEEINNLLSQANTQFDQQEFDSARQLVNNVLAIDPNNSDANELLTNIDIEERRIEREERQRLLEERILDAEADVPPRMSSSLNVNLAHLERRVPADFRQRMRELKARHSRGIPVQLHISETGQVENVIFTMTRTDLDMLQRFGYTSEIENALKDTEFSPAIKDGMRRKSILNMRLTIVW